MKEDTVARLRDFIENEMRSCSIDIGGITPEYVYRMWGGSVAIEDIETAFEELKRRGTGGRVPVSRIIGVSNNQ